MKQITAEDVRLLQKETGEGMLDMWSWDLASNPYKH